MVRLRTDPADPVESVWIRTTYDAEPVYHPCTHRASGRDRGLVGGASAGAQPGHALSLPAGRRRPPAVADRRRRGRPRRAGHLRLPAQRLPARPRLGPRRRRLPDLPGPVRPVARRRRPADAGLGGAGGLGRRGGVRGHRPADPHPALRRRPRRDRRAPRPPRAGRRDSRVHDAGVPRREQPPLQRVDVRRRRPTVGRRRRVRPAQRRGARPGLADPRRPDHQPHRRHPRVVRRRGRLADLAQPGLVLLPRRRRLRVLDGAHHAAQAQPRRSRATPRRWWKEPTAWSHGGCGRRTTWTAGGSTWPT